MSIRLKLPLTFIFGLVLTLAICVASMIALTGLHAAAISASTVSLPATELAGQIEAAALRHRLALADRRGAGEASDPGLAASEAEIASMFARYRALDIASQQELLSGAEAAWQRYLSAARSLPTPPPATLSSLADELAAALGRLEAAMRAEVRAQVDEVNATYDGARTAVLAIGLIGMMLSLTAGVPIALDLARDISGLTAATSAVAASDLQQAIVVEGGDELGQLGAAFNQMVERLRSSRDEVALQQTALERRNDELEAVLEELTRSVEARDQLRSTIRELSCPVLAVAPGVLVMPLIGELDTERAELALQAMLAAIERERARAVIVDVTGVPLIDAAVATTLVRAAGAARLLGARPILTGIRPELAQTIVGLGLELGQITTRADLREGLVVTLARP
jgi:anti-anti-sigma factor